MATTNRKPATAFRFGNVNAAVWENTGEKGPFFSVTFSRPYKDAEGNWTPARLVLLEFPSMEQARKWYDSPEYAPALKMRLKAANAKLILVEGA